MTANDAATLLRTYANALEATQPMPAARTELDSRPVVEDDIDMAMLDIPFTTPNPPPANRVWLLASLALAAALVVIAGFVFFGDDGEVQTADADVLRLVFDSETVLSTDPLIVVPAEAVEPQFDTSDLGERFQLTPITSLDDPGVRQLLDETVPSLLSRDVGPDSIVKITLLGHDAGLPTAVVVADGTRESGPSFVPESAIWRFRYLVADQGAGGVGDPLPENDEFFMLRNPETFREFSNERGGFGFGSDRVEGNAEPSETLQTIDVSLDVAALQYVTDGEDSVWTVPVDGVAVVPTRLNEESVVEVFLYSASGEQIYPR